MMTSQVLISDRTNDSVPRQPRDHNRLDTARRAFSLLELMVVLVILAIIAGALSVRWSGILQPIKAQDAIERVVQFDRKIRTFCEVNQVSGAMWYDDEEHILRAELNTEPITRFRCELPKSLEIQLVVSDSEVRFARSGISLDYSLVLQTPQTSTDIQVVGLTGQTIVTKNDR